MRTTLVRLCRIPDMLSSGLSIAIFLIILLISMTVVGQKPVQSPTPSPTPDELLKTVPVEPANPNQTQSQKKPDIDVITTETTLVDITASVFDGYGRLVPNLEEKNFKVYENKVEQKIALFSYADSPVNLGIVLDFSGSMGSKFDNTKTALGEFLRTCNFNDDILVVGFNSKAQILQPFVTNEKDKIQSILDHLTFVQPNGQTALRDATYLTIHELLEHNKELENQGQSPRKMAIMIISDGQDNESRFTSKELKDLLRESNIIIYTIVIPPSSGQDMDSIVLEGRNVLEELSDMTGGKTYDNVDFPMSRRFPDNPGSIASKPRIKLEDAVTNIAFELRNQYSIAYYPTNKEKDGKFRKIKVEIIPPKGYPKLTIRAKKGYVAPKV